MAFKRRSLALTLIAVGFAAQWVPWARIDRAAFQYHYYTALPFVVLALAYFIAEIWHGASRRTWLLARVAAGLAIMGPALHVAAGPAAVRVRRRGVGQPGLGGLPGGHPDRRPDRCGPLALAVVVVGGLVLLVRAVRRASSEVEGSQDGRRWRLVPAAGPDRARAWRSGSAIAARLPDTAILTLTNVSVEPIALIVAAAARPTWPSRSSARATPRRFVARASAWPSSAGSRSSTRTSRRCRCRPRSWPRTRASCRPTCTRSSSRSAPWTGASPTPLLTPMFAVLTVAIVVTCLVVAYSAWSWRLVAGRSRTRGRASVGRCATASARSGGGA